MTNSTALNPPSSDQITKGYAWHTLSAVRHLTVEQQMEEINARITDGEYDGVSALELNMLRHVWRLLFNRLYRFTTIH